MNKAQVLAADPVAGVCSVLTVNGATFDATYLNPMPAVGSYVLMEDMGDGSWVIMGSLGSAKTPTPDTGKFFYTLGTTATGATVFCAHQIIKRVTYAALFGAIGTSCNVGGEAADEFRVPEGRGVMLVALDNMGTGARGILTEVNRNTLGANGGSEALAAHGHPGSTTTGQVSGLGAGAVAAGGSAINFPTGAVTIAPAGAGLNNMPPYLRANLLIGI